MPVSGVYQIHPPGPLHLFLHVPHARPGMGNGVVKGCARAVLSSFFIAAILLREKDDIGFVLCYSVIYNSVVSTFALAVVPARKHPQTTYVSNNCGRRVRQGSTLNILAANVLTQIVPNSSSLYTLFYSVIYNSVVAPHHAPLIAPLRIRGKLSCKSHVCRWAIASL